MGKQYDFRDVFRTPRMYPDELKVVYRISLLRRNLGHQIRAAKRWTGQLRRTALARAIRASNSIEGYNVSVSDAIAAAAGEDPFDAKKPEWSEIIGYRDAMTYVLTLADDPHYRLTPQLIRSLHHMMLRHHHEKRPGLWRLGAIYVRSEPDNEIVYEGPDAEHVPSLVFALVTALREDERDDSPAMVRAAMTHLNLAMIHPFLDGNGRMARCLQTLVLANEGILEPEFCSIEEWLGRNTDAYYDILAQVGGGGWHPEYDARPWVRFVLKAHYHQALTLQKRIKQTERLWELLERQVQSHGLNERTVAALYDTAYGYKVRNATYRAAADVSDEVAGKDLNALVKAGLLIPKGERRGRFYVASEEVQLIYQSVRAPRTELPDPFSDTSRQLSFPNRVGAR